jgi:hypothetical protein
MDKNIEELLDLLTQAREKDDMLDVFYDNNLTYIKLMNRGLNKIGYKLAAVPIDDGKVESKIPL